ncbi:pentatricopeptide repeat-containing protein DOT4, chloroplastic-like [Aristolochia californica]|uniref:pentatricopeptide repeat-containing protein DOT4, chloroplastic-like n=1 Tax=Aristolochia californica TaxID=171875 RepID=UPI0035D67DE4
MFSVRSFLPFQYPFKSVLTHLSNLIQICTNSKAIKQGKQIHLQIIIQVLSRIPYLTTKLIQFYADCDDLVPALHLFDELPRPNVFAWTAVLACYCRNGEFDNCLQMYQDIRAQGMAPDGYVFPPVLKACANLSSLKDGNRVYGDVIKFGTAPILQVSNALIDMYSKCHDIESAKQVFDGMFARDLLSWNSIISGYVHNGLIDSAQELLRVMRLEGFEADLITWNTILDACSQMGLIEELCQVFSQIKEPNIISWTSLMLGYSRSGKHERALGIFKKLVQEGLVFPDTDILSCALSSSRHLGNLKNGQEIHGYGIKTQKFGFHLSAGAALVAMYLVCKRIKDAEVIFEVMNKCDTVTWNAIIFGLSQLGRGDAACKYLFDMHSKGVKCDQITVSTILPVCDLKSGKQIHAHVLKSFNDVTISVQNALIKMYSKCGSVGLAYSVFSNMKERDTITWNTMIGGFGVNGHGGAALRLLQEMRQSGAEPNTVTFTCLLSSCSHAGLVDEGLKLFNSLNVDFGITPSMEHFACVVDLLARNGRIEDAFHFINEMPMEPNGSIWGSLLASCQFFQNLDIAEVAAENLFRLEPENTGNYVTLSNIYLIVGKQDDALRVRKLMEMRALKKRSGYSLVESVTGTNQVVKI